jgi:hypothetical protein
LHRICFQIEQAHWFYEDFVREQNPALPSFSLKAFTSKIFHHCPVLRNYNKNHEQAYRDFVKYKVRVPVCGAIMFNEGLDKVLLVKGWTAKSTWSFPRGKINKDEKELDCAVREVYEEIGYDINDRIEENDYFEITMKEQKIRLYVIYGIPESTQFISQTRKEISVSY